MKTLLSIFGIAGMIAISGNAYGQDISKYKKINFKDVPVVNASLPYREWMIPGVEIRTYDTNNDGLPDLEFYYPLFRIEHISDKELYYFGRAFLVSIDLNGNYILEDDETFQIDYTNSQTENPIDKYLEDLSKRKKDSEEKPKKETKPTPKIIPASGEKLT